MRIVRYARYVLGTLAAVALVGVIVLTALEAGTRIDELRGGTAGAAPSGDVAELAQRLLAPPFPMPDGTVQTVTLVPGALPKDAPFDMPLPTGGRLIGSVLRTRGSAISFDAVIDATGTPDEVTAFYDRELPKKGMNPLAQPQMQPQGGFVSSSGPAGSKTYCKADVGPYVSLTVYPKPGAPSDVRVHYEPVNPNGMGTPCMQKQFGGPQPFTTKLPVLRAPDGVTLQPNGGGMGGNRQSSDATAVTSKSVAELESAFAQQLAAAGWTRVAGKADGPLAYSTWKIPGDGEWQGLLLVIESPGKDRRSLTVRAETATGF
jgi:hypothetical protein